MLALSPLLEGLLQSPEYGAAIFGCSGWDWAGGKCHGCLPWTWNQSLESMKDSSCCWHWVKSQIDLFLLWLIYCAYNLYTMSNCVSRQVSYMISDPLCGIFISLDFHLQFINTIWFVFACAWCWLLLTHCTKMADKKKKTGTISRFNHQHLQNWCYLCNCL